MATIKMTARVMALGAFALIIVLGGRRQAQAQNAKDPYPSMAPLEQYLMDRDVEIALARSSAPPSIAKDATVLVLGKHGYETAVQGTNGFVCIVGRTWTDGFDRPEFWNPKNRGPACYNPEAARSVLPIDLMRTNFALAGQTKEEIHESMKAAIAKRELPPVEPGAMIYMLSKQQRISDSAGHWHPHLMFYVPLGEAKTWGADAPDSPIFVTPRFNGAPEPLTELVIVVPEWSDGTPADDHAH
jgi:hypothetical protein